MAPLDGHVRSRARPACRVGAPALVGFGIPAAVLGGRHSRGARGPVPVCRAAKPTLSGAGHEMREPPDRRSELGSGPPLPMRRFLLVVALFSVGNSSNAFLLLRARDLGWSATGVIVLYVLFNLAYALSSRPRPGRLSDRYGRRKVLAAGLVVFGARLRRIRPGGFAPLGSTSAAAVRCLCWRLRRRRTCIRGRSGPGRTEVASAHWAPTRWSPGSECWSRASPPAPCGAVTAPQHRSCSAPSPQRSPLSR